VLRSVLPKGKTGKVITWTVEPHAIPNWIREPNIGFSQVGYIPDQPKVAVIELDKNDQPQTTASLMRIKPDGTTEQAFTGNIQDWGPYFKYNYVKFDFSAVKQPGVYYIQYGKTRTNDFLIDEHVYDKITDATYEFKVKRSTVFTAYFEEGEGIESITIDLETGIQKILMNGTIYIIRDNRIYNVQGGLVK
jgi:hypothetical protein